jgi:hypothetical protein
MIQGWFILLTVNPMVMSPVPVVPVMMMARAYMGIYYNLRESASKGKYHEDGHYQNF